MKSNSTELSIEYVLTRIDQILEENGHIKEAIDSINSMEINDTYHGGLGDQARAEAISKAIQSREATNQQILKMLDKMYDGLTAKQ